MNERVLTTLWERIRLYVSSFMEEWEELSVASDMEPGLVKPDGTSITVDQDGTIHAIAATPVDMPTKVSDLTNDSGFISDETDPTVPSWAKQPSKPTYTAQEVGALPSTTVIPSRTSQLTNDSGFVTSVPTKVSDLTNDSGFITDVPVATSSVAGKVKPDGTTITVDSDGTLHGSAQVDVATNDSTGIVKPDGTSITVDQDGTIHAVSEAVGPHLEVRELDGRKRLAIVIPEEE